MAYTMYIITHCVASLFRFYTLYRPKPVRAGIYFNMRINISLICM